MRRTSTIATILAVAAVLAVPVTAAETSVFGKIAGHYEAIRQALLHDTLDGVPTEARGIEQAVTDLQKRFGTSAAGVTGDKAGECQRLLPEIASAAHKLAEAKDLATARTAFGELSKPMVRYREMVSGTRPEVVYCPMAKKQWLQPAGTIGNPYLGQKMPTCGEIVSH
jgi:hypothetical protein